MQLTKHWAALLDDYVIDLAWSPDGTQLAAASAAGPVSLSAAIDGAKRHELPGHENGTNCLAWQAAGQKTEDRERKPEEGGQKTEESNASPSSVLRPLSSDLCPPSSVLSSPSSVQIATGGQDGAVKFWDATAGQHTATASLGSAWVDHLAWTSDGGPAAPRTAGAEIASATEAARRSARPTLFAAAGRTLVALRPDGTVAHTFRPAPKTITALAMQPARPGPAGFAGGAAAIAYFGGVVLWDTDDFIAQKQFPYGNGIHALVWSPDGKWLVSGNQDPSVHLWIPEKDIELHMSGYEGKVKFLSFDHTSRWLATSGGRDACVWDCLGDGPEGREPAMLPHEAPVCAVKFQNAHGLLATGSQDGVVQLWSPERQQPLRATVRMPAAATKLAWSPDDTLLAIGSEKGAVYVLKCEA
ncbi:MAG: WD40 repeat domain-containing protein [Verrucomicrobia bacterium]|nr:WD40 repeat domain-containing protein [Verrucomicrobiota bacterium]